ncbi:hypothetical protein CR513_38206, partial [Mucuna pruriens]
MGVEEPAAVKESKIKEGIRCNMAHSSSIVPRSLPVFNEKLFNNWRAKMLAVFGFQDVIEVVTIEFVELGRNATEEIQELVNAMRACKEKVIDQQVLDKILRTLPQEFDYVAVAIEESKDLDIIEVEELQHSLEAHEMWTNKRRSTQEQTL